MQPITGPFTKDVGFNFDGKGSYRLAQSWYRQKRPYLGAPLPFRRVFTETLDATNAGTLYTTFGGYANAWTGKSPADQYAYQGYQTDTSTIQARNKAISKFKSEAASSAQWLVNLAEAQQSIDMISKRLRQLGNFANLLRRRRFAEATNVLFEGRPQGRAVRGWRPRSKEFANTWLEYHFGWEPLIKDIYESCEFLSQPIAAVTLKSYGSARTDSVLDRQDTYWNSYTHYTMRHFGKVGCVIRGSLCVDNANLFLANQMGVINPLTVAWEIVPFSFVVDWFVNVGDFLESFSEFSGLRITNPHWTYKKVDTCYCNIFGANYATVNNVWTQIAFGNRKITSYCRTTERVLGMPSTVLAWRAPWRLSKVRALTASSLLLQMIKGDASVPREVVQKPRRHVFPNGERVS